MLPPASAPLALPPDAVLDGVPVSRPAPLPPYAAPRATAPQRSGDRYLTALGLGLLGYALLGRGFAYLGVAPLFVGEILMAAGLFTALRAKALALPLRTAAGQLLLLFCAWGALRTVPFLAEHGVDALRDAMLWGYAAFAFTVAGLLLRDGERLHRLILHYRRFVGLFVGLVWAVFLVDALFGRHLPMWPGTEVPLIDTKGGDILVHLAGVTVFLLVGFGRMSWWTLLGLAMSLATVVTSNRGGMVSFGAALLIALALRPRGSVLARPVLAGLGLLALLLLINPSVHIPGQARAISMEQVAENITSLFRSAEAGGLNVTVSWRLEWWTTIIDYTIHGPYFWTGKGFGVNLAQTDGVLAPGALRSPHNGHLTVLARMGVPGLALWVLLLGAWYAAALRGWWQAAVQRDRGWTALWTLLIAYLTAFLINAAFDVYLEGPMGGIWFWTVFGVGLAAAVAQRRAPELLRDASPT